MIFRTAEIIPKNQSYCKIIIRIQRCKEDDGYQHSFQSNQIKIVNECTHIYLVLEIYAILTSKSQLRFTFARVHVLVYLKSKNYLTPNKFIDIRNITLNFASCLEKHFQREGKDALKLYIILPFRVIKYR